MDNDKQASWAPNRLTPVTQEDVAKAMQDLRSKGVKTTLDNLRENIGRGSKSTILRYRNICNKEESMIHPSSALDLSVIESTLHERLLAMSGPILADISVIIGASIKEYVDDMEDRDKEIHELTLSNIQLKDNLKSSEKTRDALRYARDGARAESDSYKAKLDQSEAKNKELTSENSSLLSQIETLKNQIKQSESSITHFRDMANNQRKEMSSSFERQLADYSSMIKVKDDKIQELYSKNHELQHKADKMP